MDGLSQKSVAARVKCWTSLANALKSQAAAAIVIGHRLTLCDHLEKALKRPKPDEQAAAADVAALLAIQVSFECTKQHSSLFVHCFNIYFFVLQFVGTDLCEELCKDLKSVLQVVSLDKSANANARAKVSVLYVYIVGILFLNVVVDCLCRLQCCTALGLISFMAEEDIGNIYEIMHNFESIFSGSYLKVCVLVILKFVF